MDYSDKTRRPMSQALHTGQLSEEALAFVKGGASKQDLVPVSVSEPPTSTAALNNSATANPPSSFSNQNSMPSQPQPNLTSVIPGIASVTFRLPASLTAQLAQAAAERKLQRQRPFSQQDIVAEALRDWLQRYGRFA
jgi:hypothetical protein